MSVEETYGTVYEVSQTGQLYAGATCHFDRFDMLSEVISG